MSSAFENLPDDMIYVIRTFLDFTAEMALDSTSRTVRSVMRDTVHPRCKILDIDQEIKDVIFPKGVSAEETMRVYARKIEKHTRVFSNTGSTVTFILPPLQRMPSLRSLTVTAPILIQENLFQEVHMFTLSVLIFWKRIWEYVDFGQLEKIRICPPTSFHIDETKYPCSETVASQVYNHNLEDIHVYQPTRSNRNLLELCIPRTSVADSSILKTLYPNAEITFWKEMEDDEREIHGRLARLMAAAV